MKLQNYINGSWIEGEGDGTPMFDAITGEIIAFSSTEGLDIAKVLEYGRTKGSEKIRKMTFQERGNMLKSLALYLTKKKEIFYELSYRTGATRIDVVFPANNCNAPSGKIFDAIISRTTASVKKAVCGAGKTTAGIPAIQLQAHFSSIPHTGKLKALM